MEEDPNNIAMICKECSSERKTCWQENNKHTVISVDDFVKLAFTDEYSAEHMWVRVTVVGNDGYAGIVDNMPIFIDKPGYGDEVFFARDEIEDYRRRQPDEGDN